MKNLTLALTLSLLAAGCSSSEPNVEEAGPPAVGTGERFEEADEDELVPLAEVPQAAIEAALAAVPGLVLKEAEREGAGVFCLHGYADGVFTEVEVDTEGKVIEIESGDEDGDRDGGRGEEDEDGDEDDD